MKKQIYTHILTRTTLRLLLLLVMMAGGTAEAMGQTYTYTVNEVVNEEIVRSTERIFETVWETDFSSAPTGMTYSVINGGVDLSKGYLFYDQNVGSGGDHRAINTAFTDEKFAVTDTNWMLEFDWGASAANEQDSYVEFATSSGVAFKISWGNYNSDPMTATITNGEEKIITSKIPINNITIRVDNLILSRFTIIGDKKNGIYLRVTDTDGKTIYVNNVQVLSTFGYPTTFNGDLGRRYSGMYLDNIRFSTCDDFKVPYRKYNIPTELNYGRVLSNGVELYSRGTTSSEYNHPLTLPINSDKSENLEYKVTDDKKDVVDVVFLSEAEDIKGFTLCNHPNAPIRASNAAAAYVASGTGKVELATLNKGTYKLTAVFFNPGKSKVNWHIYADNDEITNYESPSETNVSEESFPIFVVENNNTKIYIGEGGGNDRGIDLIYIQRIGDAFDILKWIDKNNDVVTSVTVDISDIDDDNRTQTLPSSLRNLDNVPDENISYASSNKDVAGIEPWYEKNNIPRIKSIGTTVISATNTEDHIQDGVKLDVARYTLNVTGATNVKGDYDKETNTYSFNRPGQTANTATIEIEGVSMTYGNEGSTAVVVKNEKVGPILKVIDANGYSHPNLNNGALRIPVDNENGGTYYVFKPTIDGKLTVTGQLSNATIYKSTDIVNPVISGLTGGTLEVSLSKGDIYYLYNGRINNTNNATPLLHSFSYKPKYSVKFDYRNKIKVDGTPTIDGFAFNNVDLTPNINVIDNSSSTSKMLGTSQYTVSYEITEGGSYATLNGGVLSPIINTTDGKVQVTATISPTSGSSLTETLTATFNLMVLSGEWNFYTYDTSRQNQLKFDEDNNGIYSKDPDVWSLPSNRNGSVRTRDTEKFQYILQGGDNENEPLDIARALQSKNAVRWYRNEDKDKDGKLQSYFHLFGKSKDEKTNTSVKGGILKVPAQVDMVIDIWAASDSENAEMLINTDGNPSHSDDAYSAVKAFNGTPVTYFYLETAYNHYKYIVTKTDKDGFIYLVNSADNLYFYIKSIKLTTEIVFKEGKDVYVDGAIGETVNNLIQNADEGDRFTYTISNKNGDFTENPSLNEGNIELGSNKYGFFDVTVSASGTGILDGISDSYRVHAIDMVVQNTDERTASDDLNWTKEELKAFITKISYGPNGTDLDASVKNEVVFSEISRTENIRKVTFKGETGSQTLTIEGVGTVVIQAKLGRVVRKITITINGVALSDRSPVCPNIGSSVSFWINTSAEELVNYTEEQIEKDREWMLSNLLGDIRNYRNEGKADELQLTYSETKDEETGKTERIFTLSRADGSPFTHGGAMPIRVTYSDGSTLVGMLTIAYSKHRWKFEDNMLLYDHPTFKGIYNFYTDKNKDEIEKRLGEWSENATFDQPVHGGNSNPDNDWRFVRKMGIDHPGSPIIYYYNHSVDGDNAMILPETAGLLINSEKNSEQFGVLMEGEADTSYKVKEGEEQPTKGKLSDIKMNGTYVEASGNGYMLRNVMLKLGGELVVPCVKRGQWIEMRWARHVAGRGERMTLKNLYDVEGKVIDDTYKIGNTEQGTYMFQVDPSAEDEYVDAVFHIIDNVYITIQEVILHEPGWEYNSSMNDDKSPIQKQYITSEQCVITLGNHVQHNAPNAPCDWQVRSFGEFSDKLVNENPAFDNNDEERDAPYLSESGTTITVNEGEWGKVYATLTSYTSDYKYVANRKTWVITFGKAPAQEYPYTWDFTKYFASTKNRVGGSGDDVYEEDLNYDVSKNPTGSHELRIDINTWNNEENDENDEMNVVTTGYYDANYGSFFVNGAQLVGYGLLGDKKYNGRLPETAGLGFMFNNLDDKDNDGRLSLDMQSCYAKAVEADNNKTWRKGKLSIRGGGSIIVPRPKENAENFCIYLRSSVAPKEVVNANENEIVEVTTSIDGEEKKKNWLCKYNFAAVDETIELGNAVFTFEGNVEVYAIAVTNKFKTMTALSKTGWATESRDSVIDHTLTGYLTTNPTEAYAIVERYDNPTYSDNKAQTKVALKSKDRRSVVPAKYGLVMKQTENVPQPAKSETTGEGNDTGTDKTTGKATYQVPLFVPAVTTAVDNFDKEEFNLMRPNVEETELKDETEKVSDLNAMDTDYTRFILASRYMTWKRQDGDLTKPTGYESGEVAAFYRLHVYGEGESFDGKGAATLNTLPKNSAYLLLRTDKLNPALWGNASNGSRSYIGIEGVSDMFDEPSQQDAQTGAVGIYNLSGQKLNPDSPLAPGIYIINGKKTIVRGNHDQ